MLRTPQNKINKVQMLNRNFLKCKKLFVKAKKYRGIGSRAVI